jgi:thymidine phosphorylase
VVLHKRPGDPVRAGEPLYELRAEHAERIPAALAEAERAVRIAPAAPAAKPLVIERIG